MTDMLHSHDIYLEQDLIHQSREWKMERFGWVMMALAILLACLGLFGGGGIFLTEQKSIAENGAPIKERLQKSRIDESDILLVAREKQGLERLDQIKYAVLERNGSISIIPKK